MSMLARIRAQSSEIEGAHPLPLGEAAEVPLFSCAGANLVYKELARSSPSLREILRPCEVRRDATRSPHYRAGLVWADGVLHRRVLEGVYQGRRARLGGPRADLQCH